MSPYVECTIGRRSDRQLRGRSGDESDRRRVARFPRTGRISSRPHGVARDHEGRAPSAWPASASSRSWRSERSTCGSACSSSAASVSSRPPPTTASVGEGAALRDYRGSGSARPVRRRRRAVRSGRTVTADCWARRRRSATTCAVCRKGFATMMPGSIASAATISPSTSATRNGGFGGCWLSSSAIMRTESKSACVDRRIVTERSLSPLFRRVRRDLGALAAAVQVSDALLDWGVVEVGIHRALTKGRVFVSVEPTCGVASLASGAHLVLNLDVSDLPDDLVEERVGALSSGGRRLG